MNKNNENLKKVNFANGTFNPTDHMIDGFDGRKYLPFSARMFWFRSIYPMGKIETEITKSNQNSVVMNAKVYFDYKDTENQFVSTGHAVGIFNPNDLVFGTKYHELAETLAIVRALKNAGFGVEFGDLDDLEMASLNKLKKDGFIKSNNAKSDIQKFQPVVPNEDSDVGFESPLVFFEGDFTGLKEKIITKTKIEEPKSEVVTKTKVVEPKEEVITETEVTEPKEEVIAETKVAETKVTEPKEEVIAETKVTEPKEEVIAETKVTETKVEEPKSEEIQVDNLVDFPSSKDLSEELENAYNYICKSGLFKNKKLKEIVEKSSIAINFFLSPANTDKDAKLAAEIILKSMA